MQTPIYPSWAYAKGISGWVKLQVLIDADGTVAASWPIEAEPKGYFGGAAMLAASAWRFEPCEQGREPVGVRALVTIHFKPSKDATE